MRIRTSENSFENFPLEDGGIGIDTTLLEIGGPNLARLFAEYQAFIEGPGTSGSPAEFTSTDTSFRIVNGAIVIEALASDGSGARLLQQLEAIGLQNGASFLNTVSGLMPIARLGELGGVINLSQAAPSYMAADVGSVENQADASMQTDLVKNDLNIDGTGVTVGILSDSFDTSPTATTSYADDVASGDLPANVNVVQDFNSGGTIDEGRAMAQLIHDIAPGASLAFATSATGQTAMATNIQTLAGFSDVIVDD